MWRKQSTKYKQRKKTRFTRLYSKGKVTISIYKFINNMLTELPSNMHRVFKAPVSGHLFNINPYAKKFS